MFFPQWTQDGQYMPGKIHMCYKYVQKWSKKYTPKVVVTPPFLQVGPWLQFLRYCYFTQLYILTFYKQILHFQIKQIKNASAAVANGF